MMNSKNITSRDVTLIETWDNKIFQVEINIEEWINTIDNLQNQWKKKIYLESYKETLYFSNIKSEKWKTQYIALPKPEKQKRLYTETEKEQSRANLKKALDVTFKWRKKNFIKHRIEVLERLAQNEKRFWLQTTLEKLQELEQFRKKDIKNITN